MVTQFEGHATARLTPDLVRSASFPVARLGRRGLDEAGVRAFRDWVADRLAGMLTEQAELKAEVARLRGRVLGRGSAEDDGQARAVYILARAQQAADQYVASAQDYGKDLAADARRYGEEILSQARSQADAILGQAHVQAVQAAGAVPEAPRSDPMNAAERRDLEAELAYLRTFSEVCRAHLRAYLDSLARGLEEWERAEKSARPPS